MEIDVTIGDASMALDIENPYTIDMKKIMGDIDGFGKSCGVNIKELDVGGLIQSMIKGVAGCEHGCPADAKGLVYRGYGCFELSYVDGGILSAQCKLENGQKLFIKVFPGF
ncbi:MAG: hypothetical protein L3V56_08870 [Candidatus Magnetoovum sp. WYHC-5]|nr:hypothetical protein [Candidatus Magnetoovum sp. WYHC-5]